MYYYFENVRDIFKEEKKREILKKIKFPQILLVYLLLMLFVILLFCKFEE